MFTPFSSLLSKDASTAPDDAAFAAALDTTFGAFVALAVFVQ